MYDDEENPRRLAGEVLRGVMSVLNVTAAPLFRYPYRTSAEALRGDWKRIGGDVESAFKELGALHYDRSTEE